MEGKLTSDFHHTHRFAWGAVSLFQVRIIEVKVLDSY